MLPLHGNPFRKTASDSSHVTNRNLTHQKYLKWQTPLYPGSLCTIWSANTLLFVKLGLIFSVRFSFALLFRPNIRAVASRAIFGCGLVKQDEFALDFPLQ